MSQFFKKYRTLLIILVVAGVGTALFFVNRNRSNSTATQYQTDTIQRGDVTATIGATGTVRAKQTAMLVWQAAGTVDVVSIDVGNLVAAGDILASLKKTSLPQSVIMAEADLVSARKALEELQSSDTARAQSAITLRDAQEAYDKAANWRKELNGKITIKTIVYKKVMGRTVPQVEEREDFPDAETIKKADEDLALAKARLDDAQREYDRLKNGPDLADLAAAQARVDAAQATLNLARIIAPFDGTVTESYLLPGDQVGAGATAFRIDDLTHLYVDVEVSEVDINSVNVGQSVTLTFDAILDKDVPYNGTVVEVAQAGTSVQGVVSFKVTVELTDADELVKPGMTAAVNIVVKEIVDELLVPNRAVRLSDGVRVIYLLVDGQPVKTEVRLGSSSDTMSVVVGGGVEEGDTIILNPPTEFIGPGGGPGGGRRPDLRRAWADDGAVGGRSRSDDRLSPATHFGLRTDVRTRGRVLGTLAARPIGRLSGRTGTSAVRTGVGPVGGGGLRTLRSLEFRPPRLSLPPQRGVLAGEDLPRRGPRRGAPCGGTP